MTRISLQFDMRVPDLGTPPAEIYGAALEMSEYADQNGFDLAWTMEHHAAPDGYLPAPLTMAAAIAARTRRIRLYAGIVILPLHDPVRVAEEIAVVDLISNGRLEVAFGAGYVPREFQMFRRDIHGRAKAIEQGVPIIQRALAGERFEEDGREIFVRPLPVQDPVPLYLGGGVPAVARRAARLGVGLNPMHPGIVPEYLEECERLGREPGPVLLSSSQIHVTEDPERTWSELEPHVLQYVRSYAEMTGDSESGSPYAGMDSLDKVKESGIVAVLTPDEAVDVCNESASMGAGPALHPLLGGMSPKLGFESLELFVNKVMPRFSSSSP